MVAIGYKNINMMMTFLYNLFSVIELRVACSALSGALPFRHWPDTALLSFSMVVMAASGVSRPYPGCDVNSLNFLLSLFDIIDIIDGEQQNIQWDDIIVRVTKHNEKVMLELLSVTVSCCSTLRLKYFPELGWCVTQSFKNYLGL